MSKLFEKMSNVFNKMCAECLSHKHDIQFKHIAVLTKKVRPITDYSYNHMASGGMSIHAEMAAIKTFFKKKGYYSGKCVLCTPAH